jgi:glycosyltransferase involved in cell wall biosynthesis
MYPSFRLIDFNIFQHKNDDADEFSQAILKLAKDKALFNQYASASRQRFSRLFDITIVVKRFTDFYKQR